MSNSWNNVGAVILAAGKGTRLNCKGKPKVMLEIGNKPIVSYVVETLRNAGFEKEQTVLVVGFQKQKVIDYFGDTVTYANQEEQLGTAHAAYVGMQQLPQDVGTVLVLGGDDSAFYTADTLLNFIQKHREQGATVSVLTTEPDNFEQLGRVIRDENGNFINVLEKEELSEGQKKIHEASTGTFCINRKWFEQNFSEVKKIEGLGELGLPKTIGMAVSQSKKVFAVKMENNNEWFGINTMQELGEADRRKTKRL